MMPFTSHERKSQPVILIHSLHHVKWRRVLSTQLDLKDTFHVDTCKGHSINQLTILMASCFDCPRQVNMKGIFARKFEYLYLSRLVHNSKNKKQGKLWEVTEMNASWEWARKGTRNDSATQLQNKRWKSKQRQWRWGNRNLALHRGSLCLHWRASQMAF